MPVTPAFLAARRTEQRRRLLAHLRLSPALRIPFRSGRVSFLVPQCALTERHRLELIAAANAFFTGRQPLLGDIFQFLWRSHPHFLRPGGTLPNSPGRSGWWAQFRALYERRALLAHVRRCDLFAAAAAIRARLAEVEQDAPGEAGETGHRSAAAPDHNYFDSLVDVLGRTYHYTPEEILDLPRALVHQLSRAQLLTTPDGEISVFAPSDALLSSRNP